MRVAVYGLWHLGCVTAACLAEAGHQVVGLDTDRLVIEGLDRGEPPLYEPGLEELIRQEQASGRLRFAHPSADVLADVDLLWITIDTPVDERDVADVDHVHRQVDRVARHLSARTLTLVSSQVPTGFCAALEQRWASAGLRFACSPENLRLGKALEVFRKPDRVIVGVRTPQDRAVIAEVLAPFGARIEWMSLESAEMTKHAINAFLALSVTYANELARLCEPLGADAKEVERGLKTESRIGPRAYVSPGAAFAGGTLARDVRYLMEFGQRHQVDTALMHGVWASNEVHKNWLRSHLQQCLAGSPAPVVAMLGLTYKPGTSTLRRSTAVENCLWLRQQGVRVQAHDPAIDSLPPELSTEVVLCATPQEALRGADVAVIATEWPAFRTLQASDFCNTMRHPVVIDQNHFLGETLRQSSAVSYLATGKAA